MVAEAGRRTWPLTAVSYGSSSGMAGRQTARPGNRDVDANALILTMFCIQVNGDYNTRCVKPDRDVVVPAVTKHTKALLETFGSVSDVAPVESRKHLGFFAGGVRGFGALVRTKIGCGRTIIEGEEAPPVASNILYQQFAPGQRYLGTLNSSRFCLLPRGIPAW